MCRHISSREVADTLPRSTSRHTGSPHKTNYTSMLAGGYPFGGREVGKCRDSGESATRVPTHLLQHGGTWVGSCWVMTPFDGLPRPLHPCRLVPERSNRIRCRSSGPGRPGATVAVTNKRSRARRILVRIELPSYFRSTGSPPNVRHMCCDGAGERLSELRL